MPARRTIAERRADVMRSRRRLALTAIGAIPVLILVVVGGFFLFNRATAEDGNAVPDVITSEHRNEIVAAIADFYAKLSGEDQQALIDAVAWRGGAPDAKEFQRLNLEASSAQANGLQFEVQSLGATSRIENGVSARVLTNYGPRDVVMRRVDGFWRVGNPIDLSVPTEAKRVQVTWEFQNSYRSDDGNTLHVAGVMRNVGQTLGYLASPAAYITDGSNQTLAVYGGQHIGRPYLRPGGEVVFAMEFNEPNPGEQVLSADRIAMIPLVFDSPQDLTVEGVAVSPDVVAWQPDLPTQRVTFTNTTEDTLEYRTFVMARDADGKLLGVFEGIQRETILAGGETVTEFNMDLPQALDATARLEIGVFASPLPR